MPPSAYAMAASHHFHVYGTTREQLAEIAVVARQWALMNPVAWEKEPLSVAVVLGARMVSFPFTTSGAVESGRLAYEMAGVKPRDVDAAQLYDAFTICTLILLEDLGFCVKGEGGAFVDKGGIAPGGRFPVNTNGGGLSDCHPGMYGGLVLIEAARQIHGVCGPRQVDDAKIVLAHGNGDVLSSQCTVILGAGATL